MRKHSRYTDIRRGHSVTSRGTSRVSCPAASVIAILEISSRTRISRPGWARISKILQIVHGIAFELILNSQC